MLWEIADATPRLPTSLMGRPLWSGRGQLEADRGLRSEMSNWRAAVHYRNRAGMLLLIAEEIPRDDHKESLKRVAEYFEEMAASLERRVREAPG